MRWFVKRGAPFWDYVNKNGPVLRPELGPCWLWLGAVNRAGYGTRGKALAHRMAWHVTHGVKPEKCVLHKCDNPPCVNPGHLFLGTHADNVTDKVRKGREPRGSDRAFAKLTEDAVREIRASEESIMVVAKRYGIAFQTVHKIRTRVKWAHIR